MRLVSPSSRAIGKRFAGRYFVFSNAFSRYTSEHVPVEHGTPRELISARTRSLPHPERSSAGLMNRYALYHACSTWPGGIGTLNTEHSRAAVRIASAFRLRETRQSDSRRNCTLPIAACISVMRQLVPKDS